MMQKLPEDLRSLAGLLRAAAASDPEAGPDCLDDVTLAAVVDGRLETDSRSAAISHLASCGRCQRAVASVGRALADSGVAREISAVQGSSRRRFYRVVLPAAAAALLIILVWPRGAPQHRAPPITAAAAPVPLSPVGVVAEARLLRWTAVSGADHYRITLSNAAGVVLYEQQVTDTEMALPDSIHLVPARSYAWMVEARTGFDRWSASRLTEFTIEGSPR
jgi:hypothetical protein